MIRRPAPVFSASIRPQFGRVLLWLLLAVGFAACTETPLEPTLGSGDELSAIVDGQSVTFDFEASESHYDAEFLEGTIVGATSTIPIKSIRIIFRGVDLDNDAFPRTLTGAGALIVLVTTGENGEDLEYRTPSDISQSNTTITITATDGTIVDGTFSGTLVESDDPTDIVSVTAGSFSARLER